jgi:hypothetical protein
MTAMYDTGKIIGGLLIFLCLVTFPVWYLFANQGSASGVELLLPADKTHCVESAEYMKSTHMELLNGWRQSVVRENNRKYISSTGEEYEISLTGTCLECHSNKGEFCDKCHSYSGVSPECWNCHVTGEEGK